MFCPKCGGQNPDEGKFCRSCGTDLGNVSSALAASPNSQRQLVVNHKGKPIHWEGALSKIFGGLAFVIISLVLAFSNMGRGWWFWLLIPAFGSLGTGIAQYIQLRKAEKNQSGFSGFPSQGSLPTVNNSALPSPKTEWATPETRYKTGDLVPSSVTDNTTRHLELDSEGKTMTLPEK